jgi:hypothetical protein
MMKFVLCSFLVFFLLSVVNGQTLEGIWQGGYSTATPSMKFADTIPIRLKFIQNKDSSYSVFSFTTFKDNGVETTSVCKVAFTKVGEKKYILEETEELSRTMNNTDGFQKMHLKLKKRRGNLRLVGWWEETGTSKHKDIGRIYFDKLNYLEL